MDRNGHQLREGSREVLAQQSIVHAERVLARPTEFAAVVRDSRIDHHAVTGSNGGDVRSYGLDDAAAISPDDMRKAIRRAGQALSNEEIEVVQRGRSNADAYFARVGSGSIGHICDVELVDSAGGGEHAGAQGERR